ncbi:MAG: hypothetical protein H0V51_16765 [Chloroflexi bacterium]|nr:hypothetical protein [Chloroflexota bacterium]
MAAEPDAQSLAGTMGRAKRMNADGQPAGEEIDTSILPLVDALNAFDGISTIGSCGGHPEPLNNPSQWPEGSWYVKFDVARTVAGWRVLEFLAWLINNDYARSGHQVVLLPKSPPPYANTPGKCLSFALEGSAGEDAAQLATWMDRCREQCYIPPRLRPPRK